MAAVTICSDFGAQNIKSVTVSTVSAGTYLKFLRINYNSVLKCLDGYNDRICGRYRKTKAGIAMNSRSFIA